MMNATTAHPEQSTDLHTLLQSALEHLEHVLPGQGPILDFVHHNTIHGFQHLPFFTALKEYEALTGVHGFQSPARNRAFYRQGRITDEDLNLAMPAAKLPELDTVFYANDTLQITGMDIYRTLLLHELPELSAAQCQWQLGEGKGLQRFQNGLDNKLATTQGATGTSSQQVLQALWQQVLILVSAQDEYHPPTPENTPALADLAQQELELLFARVGQDLTLRTLYLELTGVDLLERIRPQLIRLGATLLDEGMASWHLADTNEPHLYSAWKQVVKNDPGLADLPRSAALLDALPDSPLDAIAQQLQALGLPQDLWSSYLEKLALELPGWTGLINWRQRHDEYHSVNPAKPELADFLAIRLVLDRLYLGYHSQRYWHCAPDLASVKDYFQRNPTELYVRTRLYRGALPEVLTSRTEALIIQVDAEAPGHKGWEQLAVQIHAWELQQATRRAQTNPWQLFVLSQLLGLDAQALRELGASGVQRICTLLKNFTPAQQGQTWLLAFERHYRDRIFAALQANHARGGWFKRTERPQAQIVMCMDEREESFRRHLEELNPAIETLGAAGFFGIPMRYKGLDAHHSTPLCPVVVRPVNMVYETPEPGQDALLDSHVTGRMRLDQFSYLLHQRLRVEPFKAVVLTLLASPLLLLDLLAGTLLPRLRLNVLGRLQAAIKPAVRTRLQITQGENQSEAAAGLINGFTDTEQADRVAGLLRTLGLVSGFARIVALSGHGSTSQNNPHEAAHDCGACGGRQGGPNARAFAAMANRREVRALLVERNIHIPADTWFVGMQHDTCSDLISWYDSELVPAELQADFDAFQKCIMQAQQHSALERCRRFFSAGNARSPAAAYRHVLRRSQDMAQVRPEYGHATNAAAVIGRRSMTQGVFFDRRLFLISYDPKTDPEGRILENILLTAGPVGAGINLEYYFSTIDNERFGCGTKIPHNVTGLCAVMEGAGSDLRTGLPLQMVEIHEAMRLQVIVEASIEVLTRIYTDNPPLQELIGGGWLLVSAVDPDTGAISVFDPARGFMPWQGAFELPEQSCSTDCFRGLSTAIAPVLIRQPFMTESMA